MAPLIFLVFLHFREICKRAILLITIPIVKQKKKQLPRSVEMVVQVRDFPRLAASLNCCFWPVSRRNSARGSLSPIHFN